MKSRLVSLIAAILLLGTSVVPAQAANPTPTPTPAPVTKPTQPPAKPPKGGTMPPMGPKQVMTAAQMMAGMVTPADRQAAAERAAAKGLVPATQNIKTGAKANAAGDKAMATAALLGPDYFGAFPNYANSQLPTGPVVTIIGRRRHDRRNGGSRRPAPTAPSPA